MARTQLRGPRDPRAWNAGEKLTGIFEGTRQEVQGVGQKPKDLMILRCTTKSANPIEKIINAALAKMIVDGSVKLGHIYEITQNGDGVSKGGNKFLRFDVFELSGEDIPPGLR